MKLFFSTILMLSFLNCIQAQLSSEHSLHESIGFAPTAFSLQKGEKRISNTMIGATNFTQGLSDNLSYSAGILFIPGNSVLGSTRLKYTYRFSDFIRVGISPYLIYGNQLNEDSRREKFPQFEESEIENKDAQTFHGALAGTVSIGRPDYFLNFAYAKSIGKIGYGSDYSLGLNVKIWKSISIVGEAHLIADGNSINDTGTATKSLMIGWAIKRNQILKIGVFHATEIYDEYHDGIAYRNSEEIFIPLPFLSYSYHWGK